MLIISPSPLSDIFAGMKYEVTVESIALLQEAAACMAHRADYRTMRERCKRYTYGDQWSDIINVDGHNVTEEEYILSQGNLPLKNNLIRRLVRNVIGVWRSRTDIKDPDTVDLYARTLEEFLIGGMAVHRVSPVGSRAVQPDAFFLDAATLDLKGCDAVIAGEIHDMDFLSLCRVFARSEEDVADLSAIYTPGINPRDCTIFDLPTTERTCRVVEVWKKLCIPRLLIHDPLQAQLFKVDADTPALKEMIAATNRRRVKDKAPELRTRLIFDEEWHFFMLSPSANILQRGRSPYPGGGHPFVWKGYPYIDGEIHSFVADIIDQQRYTNRLITMYDWIMRASAKGVLLFPENSLPDGVDIDDISDEWSRFNGVILFRPRPNTPLPQQVSSNATNIGITELLNIQLKMFEDISGVNGALQGKLANNAVSGTLFNSQTENAMFAIKDLLDTFSSFIRDCELSPGLRGDAPAGRKG